MALPARRWRRSFRLWLKPLLGGERALLVLLQRHIAERPEDAGQGAVRIALRMRAVLDKVAQVGNWGRAMPAGTAQGLGIHKEYKGYCACLVEIDRSRQ